MRAFEALGATLREPSEGVARGGLESLRGYAEGTQAEFPARKGDAKGEGRSGVAVAALLTDARRHPLLEARQS
jgi:hypothetical protein